MEISEEKSKIMITSRNRKLFNHPITISSQTLKQVESFKFVGSLISDDSTCAKGIEAHLSIATVALAKLNPTWKSTKIVLKTKVRFMKTIVMSTATYGCELWTLNWQSEKRVNALEVKCLRKILSIPYTARKTNISIKKEIANKLGN